MTKRTNRASGFTLIELMIVVAIVAIVLAIALPGYQEQVRKTKRSIARGELLEVAARQEQYFVNNKQYAIDLTSLGYPTNGYGVDQNTNAVAAGAGIYNIQLAGGATTIAYTLEADPTGGQVRDTRCGMLTITSTGIKGAVGSVSECW
jgi:type IV pilus assembly protein PilE